MSQPLAPDGAASQAAPHVGAASSKKPAAPGLRLDASASIGGTPLFPRTRFTVPAGSWTALLGRSGAGKSSMLRALAGLLSPPQLDGVAGDTDGAPLAGRIAYMAQQDLLAPWASALDNVRLGAQLRGEAVPRAEALERLAAVGLADKADAPPRALSGGQRQRVALARTLFEDRPVALLDEPFSALDALTREALQELACRLLAGRTVLLVTHDPLEAARLCDAAIILGPSGAETLRPALSAAAPRAMTDPEATAAAAAYVQALRAAEASALAPGHTRAPGQGR